MHLLAALATDDYQIAFFDYPDGLRQGWHTHEAAILTLNLTGDKREATGCGDRVVGAWEVGVKPPGIRHTDHFGPGGVRSLRIAFAAHAVDRYDLFTRWRWTKHPAACRALLRIADGLVCGVPIGEIDGHVHDAVAAMGPPSAQDNCKRPPAWLQAARERVFEEDGRPTLGTLAAEAGVHPVYFAARFRHFFRTSVGGFRQRVKALRAAELLRESRTSIAIVAALAGYADQPHLTHRFRAEIGITPSRFRALVHSTPPSKPTRPAPPPR